MIKASTMRRVDGWLGVPVCLALTLVRRLLDSFDRTGSRQSPRRILFVKLVEQGSTVLACSAIRRAVDLVGRDNVYFLVFEENRFILDAMGLIPFENVIAIRTNGLIQATVDALQAIRRIRTLEIDTAIDLEFFARSSAALIFLIYIGHGGVFYGLVE